MIKRVRVRIHTRKRQNIFFVAHRQKEQHRVCGAVLFSCVGGYAEKPIDFPGFVLDEMAVG